MFLLIKFIFIFFKVFWKFYRMWIQQKIENNEPEKRLMPVNENPIKIALIALHCTVCFANVWHKNIIFHLHIGSQTSWEISLIRTKTNKNQQKIDINWYKLNGTYRCFGVHFFDIFHFESSARIQIVEFPQIQHRFLHIDFGLRIDNPDRSSMIFLLSI